MAQTDYRKELTDMIAGLKADTAVKLEKAAIGRPLAGHVKSSLQALKLQIPDELMQFYEQCDGCHIVWRDKSGTATGEINVVPLSETFRTHWKDQLWFDWMREEGASEADAAQYRLARSLKGFDVMDILLDKTLIIALAPDEALPDSFRLWYWDAKGIRFPMALSPSQYITEAISCRGLLRWQLFYADTDAADPGQPLMQAVFFRQLHTIAGPMEEVIREAAGRLSESEVTRLEQNMERITAFAGQHKQP